MHRVKISRSRKLLFTVILFALAIVVVGLASGTHTASVLFLAWIPLLTVAWVLTRPEPGMAWPGASPQAVPTDEQGSIAAPPAESTPATAEETPAPEG
jgi:hypothetical protein